MFFIMGISDGRKDLDFTKTVICSACGSYGRYQVFMTYTYLSLFFIPIIKWNKQYYVQMSCCNTLYQLNSEVGADIAHGINVDIRPEDLSLVETGTKAGIRKRCNNCGFETKEDFDFCPKCGERL